MSRRRWGIKRRVFARSLTVFRLIPALLAAGGGVLLLTTAGCGGGGNGNSAPGVGQQQERSDNGFSLAVAWPTRAAAGDDSRQAQGNILSATESLRVEVRDSGGFTDTRVVNRPPAGTPDSTIVVSFIGLRPGQLTLTATAFGGANATGEVLGRSATTEQTVTGGATQTVTLQVTGIINSVRELAIPDASQIFNSVTVDGQPVPVLTVGAPPVNLDAVTVDVLGNPVPVAQGREQWASSNPAVASVDPATGVVTPLETGDVVITFTELDTQKTGSRLLRVTRIRDIQASSSAANGRLRRGYTAQLTATPLNIGGGPLSLPPGASWQALNPNIATVDANGVVTGVASGDAGFEFRDPFSDRFVRTSLRIFDVGTPSISPASPVVMNQGQGQELTLNLLDDQNNQFTPEGIWASSNPGVASVQAIPGGNKAQVAGLLPGTVTVTFTETVPPGRTPLTASVQVTVRGGDAEVIVQ